MKPAPTSTSTSVIDLPLGSCIGLASTSIFEDLIAGYDAPERCGGVGVDLTGASILGNGEGADLPPG